MITNSTSLQTALLNFILTIILGSYAIANAQPPWSREGQGGPGRGPNIEERFARVLDLTDTQKAQIKTLREQAQTATKPYFEQIKPLREEMKTLTEAPAFDETAARALAQKMAQIQIEIHLIQAKTESAIAQLLTSEQKAKLDEMHKMRQERGGPRGARSEGRSSGLGRPGN